MKISELGLLGSLRRLMPDVVAAGKVACRIQDDIMMNGNRNGDAKKGDRFTEALTDADILVESHLGSVILATFDDAAFFGEEYERDRVSAYFPKEAPYLVTLDPIDGTLYFKDGLPIFSTILTICRDGRIAASLVYVPREGRFYLATGTDGAFTATDADVAAGRDPSPFAVRSRGGVVLLGADLLDRRPKLEAAGFEVVNPSRDYDGGKDWYKTSLRLLTGEVVGAALPRAQLIDAGAIAYVVAKAGGMDNGPIFDPATRLARPLIVGIDPETYRKIASAVA